MIGNQEEVSVFRVTIIHVYEEALFYLASSRLTIVVTTDCSKENQCIWDRQFGEIIYGYSQTFWASQGSTSGKEPTYQCRRQKRCRFDPWVGKIPQEESMATHSSILVWRIPLTEEPGGLKSMGSPSRTRLR